MISIGEQKIAALYCGGAKIKRAYAGNSLVFESNKPSRLPEGYTEVEYIESTGTQYMYAANATPRKIEMDVKPTSTYGFFWGIGDFSLNKNQNNYASKGGTNGAVFASAASTYSVRGIDTTNLRIKIVMDYINGVAKVNDQEINTTKSISNIGVPYIFYFRKLNSKNTITPRYLSAYLYSYKEYNSDGVLIAEYVPCIRDSDGKTGCFDIVSKVFRYSLSSDNFIAGPAV